MASRAIAIQQRPQNAASAAISKRAIASPLLERNHGELEHGAEAVSIPFGSIPIFSQGNCRKSQRLYDDVSVPLGPIQTKLAIGSPNDPQEAQADQVAASLMNLPQTPVSSDGRLRRKCQSCEDGSEGKKKLVRKESGAEMGGSAAPSIVREVLQSPGQALDAGTRTFMEHRLGYDFGHVRVHSDRKAAESAEAVNALAYTVGSDIVFANGQFSPHSDRGQRLLAHEMAHVVQQGSGAAHPRIQRFAASETSKIAPTFADMLAQIKTLVDAATTNGQFNWDYFVEISGGSSAGRKIDATLHSPDPTIKSQLLIRYLFTCRCGLIDMRHFLQLLYISNFATSMMLSGASGNRAATDKGREHELEAEPESRFAPEDTPSNALGAVTNLSLPGLPSASKVFDAIKDTLTRCDPIAWTSLSPGSKDQIVHFYSDMVPGFWTEQIPKNQNRTAVPDILPVTECGGRERSLPFSLETSDSDRKTFEGKNFLGGSTSLTSASDIRDFITTQRPEIIKALPLAEKIRFINILMKWPIRSVDVDAIDIIYKNSTADELRAEP